MGLSRVGKADSTTNAGKAGRSRTVDYTFPLIVVEIPHQTPAKAWIAHRESDLIDAAYNMSERDGSDAGAEFSDLASPDAGDAISYLGHDLHRLMIVERADFEAGDHRRRDHGWPRTEIAVDECARELGWLSEEEDAGDDEA